MPMHLYRSSHPTGLGTALDAVRQRWAALRCRGAVLALFVGLLLAGAAQAQTGNVIADPTFSPAGAGLNNPVRSIAVQPDGKVLIGGEFTDYNGTTRNRIARLNTDGTLDTTFSPVGTGLDGGVNSIAVQPLDGKVLIGGWFTDYNGTTRTRIARLNTNGTLDPTFSPVGTGLDGDVYSIAVQPNGKVLVGGNFTDYNGTTRRHIARLNEDGTLDPTFSPVGTGLNDAVLSIVVQPGGKVLIGGWFTDYNGTTRHYIARLNDNGTLDPTFISPVGTGLDDRVISIAVQPLDGKVLVGGYFTDYDGTTRNHIARLDTNGTLDPTFSPDGTGLNSRVNSIAVQPDGKVLIGGEFTDYNSTTRNYIARLNDDGTLDATFDPGTGLDGTVLSIVVQPDGKVLIGGWFTDFNGTTRTRIARLAFPLTATASVPGGNGSISPASYNATAGSLARFTLMPASGYEVDSVTGTCGGTLSGATLTTFTTTALSADCTVIASFKPAASPAGTATATPVPTLGPWALAGLLGLMGLWGGRHLRRA